MSDEVSKTEFVTAVGVDAPGAVVSFDEVKQQLVVARPSPVEGESLNLRLLVSSAAGASCVYEPASGSVGLLKITQVVARRVNFDAGAESAEKVEETTGAEATGDAGAESAGADISKSA